MTLFAPILLPGAPRGHGGRCSSLKIVFAPSIRAGAAAIDFAKIRAELQIPEHYPSDAEAEAAVAAVAAAAAHRMEGARPGAASYADRADDRDVELVTIDPPGAMDLDQAVHIESAGDGYRVRYAIADVTAFVAPGGALDRESRRRAMTLYSPDLRTPLYPTVLSEGAASLLPGSDRPAVLWTIELDASGEPVHVDVRRSIVRSRARLDYPGAQAAANVGRLHPSIALLPQVGMLRLQAARRRHAIDLDLPDAEVVHDGGGHWTLQRRAALPVEKYNAQISLLTGMCAAQIMLRAGVGILRTLPPPTPSQVAALRRATAVFEIPWPRDVPPGDVVSELDASKPREAAFIEDAIQLLRGADYTPFDGTVPKQHEHGGLAAPYAHVTAPLRRLVDRFATEVCLAVHAGRAVPEWARLALPELPGFMTAAARLTSQLEHACTQAVSQFLLAGRVGEVLTGIVVQIEPEKDRATILLDEPPVRVYGPIDGFSDGSRAAVRLTGVADHRIDVIAVR